MTPKEKARELVYKYSKFQSGYGYEYKAKQCALIAVDLILSEFYTDDFYTEVKQELEKL
jgi:hypothetical protein